MTKNVVTIDIDLKEILPSFLENRKKDIGLIEEHLKNGNYDHIESIGHKLAGNAGSYGFADLGLIGVAIEEACQNKDYDKLNDLYEQYKSFMDNLEIEYKQLQV